MTVVIAVTNIVIVIATVFGYFVKPTIDY